MAVNEAPAARAQASARDDRSMRILEIVIAFAAIASVVMLAGIR
jgi:hypothetical protein